MRINNVFLEELHVDLLDDVRKLQISYSSIRPGAGTCFIEYVGGRIRVYEVDRFLIERLLEHLEQMGDEETARGKLPRPAATSIVSQGQLRRIDLPRTRVNRLDSWMLTNCPPRRIPMGDNCIARTPNSRVAPGGGGPTRILH